MKKRFAFMLLAMTTLSGELCAGDPVALNIQGKIVAAPCQVSSDSVAKTVNLTGAQGVRAASMSTPGSATDWVPFDFTIERCPAGTVKATMLLSGEADSAGPEDLYQNTGSAGNIAIQLQTLEGQPLGNNKSLSGTIVNNGYQYHLRARAYSPQGNVTPGTINAVVTMMFTWQ
ncbi:fimbrial protein [Trabulsiella odontotermitis]|uniref:fimbrial protein n=1 Tax=Trabulsiella odontotermitis TaxID=379893 RepID=UPI0006760CE1|nr:fimbrial protein [Trabulsiella odontotermitis]KNC91904.1 fimbrial protein [Trabulsiella odontotermitis]